MKQRSRSPGNEKIKHTYSSSPSGGLNPREYCELQRSCVRAVISSTLPARPQCLALLPVTRKHNDWLQGAHHRMWRRDVGKENWKERERGKRRSPERLRSVPLHYDALRGERLCGEVKMISLASCLSQVIVLVAAAISASPHTWEEEGVIYGHIGGSVTLRCGAHHDSPVALWKFSGSSDAPWEVVSDQQELRIPNVQPSSRGNYTCHGQRGELLSTVLLRVGYPPGIPSVTCRASDFHNFSCYWTPSVETLLPTRYITTYSVDKDSPGVCVQDPVQRNMCVVQKSKPWMVYRMNITEVNPLGFNFRIMQFTVHSIIKPDPPENLSAEPIPFAPRRLRVTWTYPPSWPSEHQFQLKFRLQYRPVVHLLWSVVETANLSDVITDAFVGMEHVLQVSARDFLDAGNWSEWSMEVRATPWTSKATSEAVPETSNETTTEGPEAKEPIDYCCTANQSDPAEKVAMLISLGIFAFVVLALFLIIGALIWVRIGKTMKDGGIKPDFLTAIHMKALPNPCQCDKTGARSDIKETFHWLELDDIYLLHRSLWPGTSLRTILYIKLVTAQSPEL
ncbi:interleukin-11 receptor subunit alpha [Gastrophryne carolinensis]